jgi:hypothetical protein
MQEQRARLGRLYRYMEQKRLRGNLFFGRLYTSLNEFFFFLLSSLSLSPAPPSCELVSTNVLLQCHTSILSKEPILHLRVVRNLLFPHHKPLANKPQ